MNQLQSFRMWARVSTLLWLQGHAWLLWGKNLFLNSPIGAWLRIALVVLAQSETEDPIWLSHPPPLIYDGWIHFFLLILSCKNWWSLLCLWLKMVIHWSVHALLDLSLKASNEVNWDGVLGTIVLLASSSTIAWRCHLALLEQYQNSILLLPLRLKKDRRKCTMAMDSPWPEWCEGPRAFFAEERESVMTTMRSTPREVALAIPQRMATSSAFGAVIFPNAALDEMTWVPLRQP